LNWNGKAFLEQFLPSVTELTTAPDSEIWVADNGSTVDSLSFLRQRYPNVKTLAFDSNYGFAGGYNKALQQIEAEYVVLLNSDIEATANWLEPLVAFMDANPDVAACAPKLLAYCARDHFEYAGASGGFIDRYGYPFCRGRILDTTEPDLGQYNDCRDVFWATGACLMVRSDVYRTAGGLDDDFFAHMEEIDLCWRLRTMGKSIVCIAESRAYHLGGATLNQGNPRKTFLNFRNNLLMLYKNLPDRELKSVMRVRCFLDYLAAFQFLIKGGYRNCTAIFKARRAFAEMRPDFEKDRRHIQQIRKNERVPERVDFSLLWQYYVKGQKTFRALLKG
jgi:GT2 family glycosyltransferase